jgi:hypothetical protein
MFWPGRVVGDAPNRTALEAVQVRLRLADPLDFTTTKNAMRDMIDRTARDETFALDVVDFALFHLHGLVSDSSSTISTANRLGTLLHAGGSVWEVVALPDEGRPRFQLSRRAVGPVREAIMELPASTRAHQHLVGAWNRLSGRSPDESSGYREAVRAVEAAAKPIILPTNDRATLGTMIAAMRDKPEKWETTLGSVDDVRRLMEVVWIGQLDRHGTDDETVPLNVSPEEADAAFAVCLTLARLFVGGHVRRL